jgi:NAD(P)-dependent dehydrogenase (short-subunit alcohol dehydrogenase family)
VVVGVRHPDRFETLLGDVDWPDGVRPPAAMRLDISEPDSILSFMDEVVARHGRIDVLVNNAFPRTDDWGLRFEQVPSESLYRNLCDHAGGYFLCSQSAARLMMQQRAGVILNMGSIYGEVGPRFPIYDGTHMTCAGAYPLIKGGIRTLTKYLATYLGPYGIRVNCLSPGGIRDEGHQAPRFIRQYEQSTPLGRMGSPDDVVGPLVFLISDASRYVTGAVLMVDGGWTAW